MLQYSREELFLLADLPSSQAPLPEWSAIIAEFPVLERKVGSVHQLPYDGLKNNSLGQFAANTNNYDNHLAEDENFNNNKIRRKNSPGSMGLSGGSGGGKKNFLEVLRPDAPVREWSEELGEWIECGSGGNGGAGGSRDSGQGHTRS